jgi:hypothetical protein
MSRNILVWKGITCQKVSSATITIRTLKLWWSNTRNKQLWNGKKILWLLGQISKCGNNRNTNWCKFYEKIVICMNPKTEWTASFIHHHHPKFYVQLKAVCTNDMEEYFFFTAKLCEKLPLCSEAMPMKCHVFQYVHNSLSLVPTWTK